MPPGLVDSNGEGVWLVGLVAGGAAITVYSVAIGIANTVLAWQRSSINQSWCCKLKNAALTGGVDLDAIPTSGWTWEKRFVYCRHCLDCNQIRVLKDTVPIAESIIGTVPETSFTGPVTSDPLDLVATAVQSSAEAAGKVVTDVSVSGGTATYHYVDPSTAPCHLPFCKGFVP
jgi:hypothetical protein